MISETSLNANAKQQQPGGVGDAIAVTLNNITATTTPKGFNSSRRGVARYILWFVVLSLMSGKYIWASIFSAMSIILLKEGTIFSGKNLKWMILSMISLVASLLAFCCYRGSTNIDEEKAYTLYIMLWMTAKSIQCIWGIILGLFLFSAATATATAETEIDTTTNKPTTSTSTSTSTSTLLDPTKLQ